jgi:hypothetical protein
MSGSADCCAATAARPDGLVPRDKLAAEFEPSHHSVYSAETDDQSLVINDFEVTNSHPNRLAPVSGHCAFGEPNSPRLVRDHHDNHIVSGGQKLRLQPGPGA